ncbi:MAG: ABC transporter ATP-binding protein [Synechococcales bacterium]|nr:ABC transporter ATP-binding protein [Synechococcales bacterium]
MSPPIIQVEHLSKRYTLGRPQAKYQSLRETWSVGGRQLWRRLSRRCRSVEPEESFWALKDVSFAVNQGDRVGIVGRNGAGKSTLLKILSRITEPTVGEIRIRGRVASLLEVGTGFHPELTGRENIFLNGAILGMGRTEICRKFDEIVAFAEVERFLDTPVKRYSSGMYVRLAFAVAAHLEPEILVVDEVLAVGDVQFQNKCLGKMQDVTQSGRTVLFVSHNMAAIRQLCNTAIFLQQGQLTMVGSSEQVIKHYLNSSQSHASTAHAISRYGLELIEITLEDGAGNATRSPIFDRHYALRITLAAHQPLSDGCVVVRIYDAVGTLVSSICTPEEGIAPCLFKGQVELRFELRQLPLFPGQYRASVFVHRPNDPVTYFEAEDALTFEVHPAIVQDAMWAYRPDHGIVRLSQSGTLKLRENLQEHSQEKSPEIVAGDTTEKMAGARP